MDSYQFVILFLIVSQVEVIKKLSCMLSIMLVNLFIGTAKLIISD
jgi:hypothetical protein